MAQRILEKAGQTGRSRQASSATVKTAAANKREFLRTATAITAELQPEQGNPLSGQVTDLSMKGLHFACDKKIPLGSRCQIDILLTGSKAPSPLLPIPPQIKINARIRRHTATGMGVEFTAIVGQQSFIFLQQLLRHLSPDRERIEAEIQASSWSHTKEEQHFESAFSSFSTTQTVIKRRQGRHLPSTDQR